MKTINIIIGILFLGVLSSTAQTYEYDALNRVTKVVRPGGQEVYYAYDELGNRTQLSAIVEVEEIVTNEAVNIYPNPASYTLNIQFLETEYQNLSVEFTDITGKKVLTKQLSGTVQNTKETIDVSSLQTGTYIIQIKSGKTVISSEKIMINK